MNLTRSLQSACRWEGRRSFAKLRTGSRRPSFDTNAAKRTPRTASLPTTANWRSVVFLVAVLGLAVCRPVLAEWASGHSGTIQSTRLYTKPDPTAGGGLRGQIEKPAQPLLQVFAMPDDDPRQVYKGQVLADGRTFSFTGLPVSKYGLLLLYEDGLYEGLALSREADTLTPQDIELIKTIIMRAVPFFDTKAIHRCAGTTGRDGKARCVLQELRTKLILNQMGEELKGTQIRSIKLAWLEDVGAVGWQLVNTREIVRTEVAGKERKGVLAHHYHPRLGGIRVIDTVKDLGPLNLETVESE